MLLSSSLEPNGPRSIHHYLVLHHENQRKLIRLPESYSDLEEEIESSYQIDRDRFHIETKELNVCAGESIRIPEEAWEDLSRLLGNVYVVLGSKEEMKSELALEREVSLKREAPSIREEKGNDESEVSSKNKEMPKTEELLKREESSDSHPESFPGPNTVNLPTPVQSGSESLTTPLDKDTLYEQILACEPCVPGALAAVRKEITLFGFSRFGIKCRSQRISCKKWANFEWDVLSHSIFVVRYSLTEATSSLLEICFLATTTHLEFDIDLAVNNVGFWEENNGFYDKSHTFKPSHSMRAAGDHSIALVNHGGQIHVFFDSKQSTILPRATMMTQKLDKIWVSELPGIIDVDVYDFV